MKKFLSTLLISLLVFSFAFAEESTFTEIYSDGGATKDFQSPQIYGSTADLSKSENGSSVIHFSTLDPWGIIIFDSSNGGTDLSDCEKQNGTLEFKIKSANKKQKIQIYFTTIEDGVSYLKGKNITEKDFKIGKDWQTIRIPLKNFETWDCVDKKTGAKLPHKFQWKKVSQFIIQNGDLKLNSSVDFKDLKITWTGNKASSSASKTSTARTQVARIDINSKAASNPKYPKDKMAFVTKPVSMTPKIQMNDENYGGSDLPWKEASLVTVTDECGNVLLKDADAKVNVRGNYTTCYDKKPLRISFAKKQSMLGLHDGKDFKNWVLLASWKDHAFLRDMTAFNFAKLIDSKYYASDSKLVEVYINNTYWGVYILAEQQDPKHIGLTDAKDGNTQTGYVFEMDSYAWTVDDYINKVGKTFLGKEIDQGYFFISSDGKVVDYKNKTWYYGMNRAGYTLKSEYSDAQKDFIKNYLTNVNKICIEAIDHNKFYKFTNDYKSIVLDKSVKTAEDCISKVLDIDSLVNTYILCELACDPDLDYSSFYMTVDFGPKGNKKVTFQAPWDFDHAFGHKRKTDWKGDFTDYTKNGIKGLYAADNNDINRRGNPWTVQFAKAKWFQNKVLAKWNSVKGYKTDLLNFIDEISNDPIYAKAFARDKENWKNSNRELYDLCEEELKGTTQRDAANFLKDWIEYRFKNLDPLFKNFK